MVQRTATPTSPSSAQQRGAAASVPRMRQIRGVTGTASASGTPPGDWLASSETWKSTRNAAPQAPQALQWSIISRSRAATFLELLAAAAWAGLVAPRAGRGHHGHVGGDRLGQRQLKIRPPRA